VHVPTIPPSFDFPDVDKPYVESIRGRLEPKVSPKRRHGILQLRFASALAAWAGDRGEVGTEWRCYLLGEGRPSSLVPDVSYFSFERLPWDLPDDARERPRIAPDVAVEIHSPGDRRRTTREKIGLYLAHGSRAVIVADPLARTITLHGSGSDGAARPASGTLKVPPYDDLSLDLDALFLDL
jgi:Uma2 family endonuclease